MVTSYCMIKMSKNKRKVDTDDKYYSNLLLLNKVSYKTSEACRICLQKGKIPIYGDNTEIAEALVTFGDIRMCEEDDLPKHVCEVCFKFVKRAVLFRSVAKQSDVILRRPARQETDNEHEMLDDKYPQLDSPLNDNDLLPELNPPSNENDFRYLETENEENVKVPAKVQCKICSSIVTSRYYKHHLTMHDPNHSRYVCETCGKSFRLKCSYYNHKRCHRNDFPLQCQYCPYRARYSHLLKSHMRTHTGEKKFMCNKCPSRFLFRSNLNCHLKRHQEPQFKCDVCNKGFYSKWAIKEHIQVIHMGIKPHTCSICGNRFGYMRGLKLHQRNVHKLRREKLSYTKTPSYLVAQQQDNL